MSERAGYTIDEFCERWGFKRSTWYTMERKGKAARTMDIGSRRIITVEAEKEWSEQRQAEAADKAPDPERIEVKRAAGLKGAGIKLTKRQATTNATKRTRTKRRAK